MPKRKLSFEDRYVIELAYIAKIAKVGAGDVFLYAAQPTRTQGRWVFQSWIDGVPGVQAVCLSEEAAAETVYTVLAWCKEHPDEAEQLTENYRTSQ